MPKTKDAFAFRDFNVDKILQRKFFSDKFDFEKDFEVSADSTNKDFLAAFKSAGQNAERRRIKLKELAVFSAVNFGVIKLYEMRLSRHMIRIAKILDALAYKIANSDEQSENWRRQYRRAKDLDKKYFEIDFAVSRFRIAAAETYEKFNIVVKRAYRKKFSERLKWLRRSCNFTQTQLAAELDITVGAYQFYEKGKSEPSLITLIRLCNALKVSPDNLLGFKW